MGVEDSPMTKRGCAPFSMSTTDLSSRRAIIAISDPPKPEPTIAMSKSAAMARDSRGTPGTVDSGFCLLREIHSLQARPTFFEAVGTTGELLQVPGVREDASPLQQKCVIERFFKQAQRRWAESSFLSESVQSSIAEASGNERNGRGMTVERKLN